MKRLKASVAIAGLVGVLAHDVASAGDAETSTLAGEVTYHEVDAGGVRVFYRDAGPRDAPVVLLLHGFPASSFMFRNLIPELAKRYRVIAPDYPGFGHSAFPDRSAYHYTFEHLTRTMDTFVTAVGLKRYTLYVQDYGAPIGLRLALQHPERVEAMVVQNGNAYEEGLSAAWTPLREYWRNPNTTNREQLRGWLTADGVRAQYLAGLPPEAVERLDPDTWTLDWLRLSRPGNADAQLDLLADYASNVGLYPNFHAFFREYRPPTLIVWGLRDPFFTPDGARAYLRDLPNAELHWLDAGHFALETHCAEISARILEFLDRQAPRAAGSHP